MAEIRVESLKRSFGSFNAVRNSNFVVEDGEFLALLGPSGCGKTTTLRMIAGLELPTSGKILLDGGDVTMLRARDRDIAFVFQLFALYPHMNVRRNISYPLVNQGVARAEIAERVGFPVVAKGISPAITHRAAAGFVELNLWTADAVQRTDADYRRRAEERSAPYEGTWVQRMITGNRELLVTAFRDSDFGTMVGVGIGGNMTEIVDDVTFTRAPIDADGAYDLVGQLRSVRKHPDFLTETQRRAAADFIRRFSALVASAPWRRFTLEVNPLKLDTDNAAAVDGLLIVEDAKPID